MSAMTARAQVKEIYQEVRVTRCGCGDPDSHNGTRGPSLVCPKPLAFDVRRDTRINYWHRNPVRRLLFTLKKAR